MNTKRFEGLRPPAIALGWVVAIVSGILLGSIFGLVVGAFGQSAGWLATVAAVGASLLTGFLAHLIGGFCAARSARVSGGLNGAMIAVLGFVMGVFPSITFAVFGGLSGAALAVPQVNSGLAVGSLLGGLVLFLVNLFGGYVGGRLGGRSPVDSRTHARPSSAGFEG